MKRISAKVAEQLKDYYINAEIRGAEDISNPEEYFNLSYLDSKNEIIKKLFAEKDRLSKDICVKLSSKEKLSNYDGDDRDMYDKVPELRRDLRTECLEGLKIIYRELFAKIGFGIIEGLLAKGVDKCLIPNYERVAQELKEEEDWDLNVFTGHEFIIPFSERQKVRFSSGMKLGSFTKNLLSVIQKFKTVFELPETDDQRENQKRVQNLLEELNIALSRLKQQQNIKGKLFLSCDPMDYLSASDNNCKWGSCFSTGHGYADQGSNAVHALGVMNSNSVVIAYLNVNGSTYDFEGTPIPDKTLRAWVEIQDGYVKIAKTYPFDSEVFKREVAKFISELMPQYKVLEDWENQGMRFCRVYNDPAKIAMKTENFSGVHRIEDAIYGARSYDEIEDPSDSLNGAQECCDRCGDVMDRDDMIWDDETDAWYCPQCYNQLMEERREEEEEERRRDEEGEDDLFWA